MHVYPLLQKVEKLSISKRNKITFPLLGTMSIQTTLKSITEGILLQYDNLVKVQNHSTYWPPCLSTRLGLITLSNAMTH